MVWIKKSAEFLPIFSKEKLKKLYNKEKNSKAKLRLLSAIQRKDGKTLDEIAYSLQKPKTTIHDWLKRLEDKGINNLYDVKQPGKPCKLTKKELNKLEKILDESPEKQKIPYILWTTKLVQYIIQKEFGKGFGVRHIRRIIKQINFSLQIPRQEHRKANKKLQEKFKIELKKKFNIILNLDLRSSVLMKHISS
jgi:transposase